MIYTLVPSPSRYENTAVNTESALSCAVSQLIPNMAMQSLCLLFWSVLFSVVLFSIALEYSNRWTVQIDGDSHEADRLARKHGFVNQGKVSRIEASFS